MTTYCDEYAQEIDYEPIIYKYDLALDADDGYGDYAEIYLCRPCADIIEPAPVEAERGEEATR